MKLIHEHRGIKIYTQFEEWTCGPGITNVFFGKQKMISYGYNPSSSKGSDAKYVCNCNFLKLTDKMKYALTEEDMINNIMILSNHIIDKMSAVVDE